MSCPLSRRSPISESPWAQPQSLPSAVDLPTKPVTQDSTSADGPSALEAPKDEGGGWTYSDQISISSTHRLLRDEQTRAPTFLKHRSIGGRPFKDMFDEIQPQMDDLNSFLAIQG